MDLRTVVAMKVGVKRATELIGKGSVYVNGICNLSPLREIKEGDSVEFLSHKMKVGQGGEVRRNA